MMQLFNAENGKERQKTMRVLNFGSLNLDYVYTVDHFVMPGETISSTSRTIKHGGKGLNQSVALARAGADVAHAGCIGEGDESIRNQCDQTGCRGFHSLEKRNKCRGG